MTLKVNFVPKRLHSCLVKDLVPGDIFTFEDPTIEEISTINLMCQFNGSHGYLPLYEGSDFVFVEVLNFTQEQYAWLLDVDVKATCRHMLFPQP